MIVISAILVGGTIAYSLNKMYIASKKGKKESNTIVDLQ